MSGFPEFCWTWRRSQRWKHCRRAYYYYYYGSFGGHDEAAPRRVRELYLAKCSLPLPAYCRYVQSQVFRRRFYAPLDPESSVVMPDFFAECFAFMRRDFELFASGRGIPRRLVIDWINNDGPWGEVWALCEAELRRRCSDWERATAALPAEIPYARRVFVATPLRLQIGELAAALAPLIAYRIPGKLMLLENTGHSAGGKFISTLGKFAAAQQWNLPPDAVKSGIFDPAGKVIYLEDADISQAVREIRADVSEMTAALRTDGSAAEADFPGVDDGCESCPFIRHCRHRNS